ncbi:hypothetical protein GLAREA_05093 [Glarea lozoyensis ATCC 20868]|uniref:Heterokaryon incompatibility domain-containing protein n=1 Tax=Glarea lozoyensis (strain ATCC 20868 / MF5171) TaxID=1116229 RepID=S3DDG1_GLAL2|nr:uncharacterized protein GLAREA_05093 [Glarea lozoyensis ATCC 20868]EPE35755.1 hypothetical protein GLAREA_05093 [Glarea lozoyensis ATCC 20868]
MPGLCNKCQTVELHYRSEYRRDEKPVIIKQYGSLAELKTPAGSNCSFCSLLLRSCRSDYATRIPVFVKGGVDPEDLTKIICRYNQGVSNIEVQYSFRKALQTTHFRLGGLYTHGDSSIAQYIPGRPISEEPGSEEDFQLYEDWTQECEENHPRCQKAETLLPTRVIDVGSPDGSQKVHLFVPEKGFKGRYLTLLLTPTKTTPTHVLTASKLSQSQKSISLSTLPLTLQDAITTTRRLGHRYIYIPSLCIIQDSPSDRAAEMRKLGDVYANSCLTISVGEDDGFLGSRTLGEDAPLLFYGINGSKGRVYIRSEIPGEGDEDAMTPEHYLSPRILSFGKSQTTFFCPSASYQESLAHPQPPPSHHSNPETLHSNWTQMISDFTAHPDAQERLPLLNGLAERVEVDDSYHFGHWRSQLPGSLLWNTVDSTSPASTSTSIPSWSWPSTPGEIHFEPPSSKNYCTLHSLTPSGTISLQTHLAPLTLLSPKTKKSNSVSWACEGQIMIEGTSVMMGKGTVRFDSSWNGQPVMGLVVTGVSGLVVQRTGEKDGWRRVGRYRVSKTGEGGEGVRRDRVVLLV